jgi:hypothetical protein
MPIDTIINEIADKILNSGITVEQFRKLNRDQIAVLIKKTVLR